MNTLDAYKSHVRRIGRLESAIAVLYWDQRSYIPDRGNEARAEVIGELTRRSFELSTSDTLGRYLEDLEGREGLTEQEAASLRVVGRNLRRKRAIPSEEFERFTIAQSKSETAWAKAREVSDFRLFQPHLEEIVDYVRRFADYIGYEENRYDALLEEYEPGLTSRELRSIIPPLRDALVPFLRQLMEEGEVPGPTPFKGAFPIEKQNDLSMRALRAIGFDFEAGRLDTTVHPFTITNGPGDVRVMTRFDPHDLKPGLFASLHEGGHGTYEQSVDPSLAWTGIGEGASSGLHEAQSRLWENLIGRSRPFWVFFQPILAKVFPAFNEASPETLYRAANVVRPSFIRVEADEVTYNLHIMLRFELEEDLINERIGASDLPDLWREAMREYLGVIPEDDAQGMLQDVHWSMGLFGYFPSYMLGNLYGAQIYAAMCSAMPDIETRIENGNLIGLLEWLRETILRHGMTYEPMDLLERVTGSRLDPSQFLRYVTAKFSDVYRL